MPIDFEVTMNEYLPLRDVVFNTLRRAILKGELKPGERLMELTLAERLGVSRTPIREAIRKLELEGLVVMAPRKGAKVASITERDLNDVLEVRKGMEVLAISLACERITKEEIEHLSNSQDLVYMGIIGGDVTTTISEQEDIPIGVYVSEVAMDSPAMAGGIQPGDIITSMSGQQVTNLKDVRSILLKCSNGQNIQVVCQRPDRTGYQELEVTVQLTILE